MSLNVYELEIRAVCPVVDGEIDVYQARIESATTIEVERILAFFAKYAKEKIFQEDLTLKAATSIGAKVQTVGFHSGVKVTCTAP